MKRAYDLERQFLFDVRGVAGRSPAFVDWVNGQIFESYSGPSWLNRLSLKARSVGNNASVFRLEFTSRISAAWQGKNQAAVRILDDQVAFGSAVSAEFAVIIEPPKSARWKDEILCATGGQFFDCHDGVTPAARIEARELSPFVAREMPC